MSQVILRFADNSNGQYLADVSVYSLNSAGKTTGLLGTSNQNGEATIEAPPIGGQVQVSYPGYIPQTFDPNYVSYDDIIGLDPNSDASLDQVIIKSVKKIAKQNYTLPIVLGSASVILFGVWLYKTYA